MGRKNQRLINFHTSGLTSMPVASDVHYGEIVVRHNEQQPELLIKVSESEFAVIPGSGAVASAISVAAKNVTDYVDGEVNTIESSITSLQKTVSEISTNIGENYVSKTAFEQAQGELFTSATTVASDDATAKANKAKDDAIAAAAASATTLLGLVDAVDEKVDEDVKALADYKTEVSNTYETKDNVSTAITAAKTSVYSSATTAAAADATTKANNAKSDAIAAAAASAETLNNKIEAVDGKVDTVSTSLEAFKATVADTYATKTGVTSDIKDAKDSVYSSATTAAFAEAKSKADAAIAAAAASANTLQNNIDAVNNSVTGLSANVHTRIESLETGLTNTINEKVARAYRYAGSCTYEQLTGKTAEFIGEVWNVTDANGDFPAGTNYAWNGTEWDALGGSVDLSPYALKTEVNGATKTLQDNIDAANGRINTVSASLDTFKTFVANTYETKDNVSTAITAAKDSVYLSATTAAAADAKTKADTAYSSAVTAAAASAETLNNSIEAVDNKVTGLSASTINIEITANSAIQNASIVDGDSCKVSVSKDKTELKFDFSNLVIDCGDF